MGEYFNIGLAILTAIIIPAAGFLWNRFQSNKKETLALIKEVDCEIDQLGSRVQKLETKIEHMPSQQTMHDLNLSISDMRGDLKAITATVESNGNQTKASSESIKWIEKYLRENKP
jgi:peptidoglycan hydrolase CwlO-like protein